MVEGFFDYILVLAEIPSFVSAKIRYSINDINAIMNFPRGSLVELKVNTGMNRNGVETQELDLAIELIKKRGLKLEAIFTHHGCADELNELYETQTKNFELVKQNTPKGLRFHSCNSAALFRSVEFDEDMARVGIAAYGCMSLPFGSNATKLKPVLSLYAKKISSRVLKKGSYVGYGATFEALEESLLSNYDFGYGDGFLRSCSNSYETPEGVKIAGRISMDNSSFLSDEDEILIFNDANEVSKFANTISYEVLTSLKSNIKRGLV